MRPGSLDVVLLADADGRIVDVAGDGLDSLQVRPAEVSGSLLATLGSSHGPLFPTDRLEAASRDGEARYDLPSATPGAEAPLTVHLRLLDVAGVRLLRARLARPAGTGVPEAEDELRRKEAEIRALVESTEDRIWSVDRQYRLIASNHHIESDVALRLGRPLLPGESIFHEGFPSWMNDAWRENYDRALGGESFVVERQTSFFNPSEWWEFRIGPIRDERGEVTGVLVIQRNITGEKEARAALERSQAELAAIYEHAPVMMCVVDRDRRVLFANEAFTRFTGVDEAELRLGRACGVFGCINAKEDPLGCGFGPRCAECDLRLAIADTFATGTPHHDVEYRATLEHGGWRRKVVLLCATAFLGQEGAPRLLLCMQDISDRVLVSEALAESERRYRDIYENAAEGIFQTSPEGRLLSANPACARIFGYASPAEMLAEVRSITDELYARPEYRARFKSLLESHGEVRGFETAARRRDGASVWVSLSARVVPGGDGKPLRFEGIVEDVTERKAAEQASRRDAVLDRALSELYRPVVSPETDVPVIARVVFEQALRLTGSPCAFVAEIDPLTGALSPHVLSGMMEEGPEGRVAGSPLTFPRGEDGRYRGLSGHALNVRQGFVANAPSKHPAAVGLPAGQIPLERLLAVPVLAGDELVGEIAVANAPSDYTDRDLKAIERLAEFYALGIQRKRVEAKVRSLAESLETRVRERTAELLAVNRELEAFAYSVSHDLRAPLRAIVGFTQAVLEDVGSVLPPAASEDLGRAIAAAHRMSRLIDGLLGLSRLTRREMQRRPVDLSALATELVADLRAAHPDRVVDVVVEEGIEVRGDPELLRIVLHNLLENAWKFTTRVARARIEVGSTTSVPVPPGNDEGRCVLFVRENGVGFDMAYADKLFRPFHRLHAEAEFPGSGIGLASAQRIVHRHGGQIWAESAPGAGATFYFTLEEIG